jgi:formamidopyrimidine-DNA glycosylase
VPELPEVETVRRGLQKLTLAQTIDSSEVLLQRSLAYPASSDDFRYGIAGKQILTWRRRGKYLLAKLTDNGGHLGVHLRMTGQLLWVKRNEPLQKHARIRLFLGEDRELRFVDTRTFGKVWWIPPDKKPEEIITGLQLLGVEPLEGEFFFDYFANKLRKSQRKIKNLLLDQSIVAGIGNIYADECLFKSKIHPEITARSLQPQQVENLRLAIIEVLKTAIEQGGTTFSDFLQVTGVNGNYGGMALVYGRKDLPCRVCETKIEKIKLGGRSSHFCPQCQPKNDN